METFYQPIDVLHATARETLSSVFMTTSNTNLTVQPHQLVSALIVLGPVYNCHIENEFVVLSV